MVDICYVCHPFYTGKQKFVDAAGRVTMACGAAGPNNIPSRPPSPQKKKKKV